MPIRFAFLVILGVATMAAAAERGVVQGRVLNGSQVNEPIPNAQVILRLVEPNGLVPVGETTTDESGRFRFEKLPADLGLSFVPGANWNGIHYPGKRVRLIPIAPEADVTIVAHDCVAEPNPLIAKRHSMEVESDEGMLRVTETILIENPSLRSYVGKSEEEGASPVTLRLSLPPDFAKVVFAEEFYGRQFTLGETTLQTDMPWTPGKREVKFTYYLPFESRRYLIERTLDLPVDQFSLRLPGELANDAQCNLDSISENREHSVEFRAQGSNLEQGFVVKLELGDLPLAWTTYARWVALTLLASLITALTIGLRLRKVAGSYGAKEPEQIEPATPEQRAA
ncbi:MAG: carboxypeptidase regulatory-like domain-containing protein [Planctomycetales bacterium]|nr:carboxypeptidase regulatory-like domain-containing protein [Planctomycetales bacterium]